jgi:cyclic pyranopterin phosphate synthase
VTKAAVALGVKSLRFTGGEPLLYKELDELIGALQPLRREGLQEIALTSNGLLLSAERAQQLREAGLDRLTLSLDGTTGTSVAAMAGLANPAQGALKLNAVIQRGRNEEQVLPLAQLCRQRRLELRLIEYMDVGNRNGWRQADVVQAAEMVCTISEQWPLEPLGRAGASTASRWRYRDGRGCVAMVASVSKPFCGDCNRLRVTADGIAYTCLFAATGSGVDLKPSLAASRDQGDLHAALYQLWRQRADRFSEERSSITAPPGVHAEMAYLGG